MMEPVVSVILEWLRPLAARHAGVEASAETDLIESGLIDSIEILNLVCFVEERFGFNMPIEAFVPENFRTPRALAEMIGRLGAAQRL